MFEQLKTPTDNLYKFIAISGVGLVALGFWLSNQNKQITKSVFIESMKLEIKEIQEEFERKCLFESIWGAGTDVSYKKILSKIRDRIENDDSFRRKISEGTAFEGIIAPRDENITEEEAGRIICGIMLRTGNTNFSLVEIESDTATRLRNKLQKYENSNFELKVCFTFGGVFIAVGFGLWFMEVQYIEDKLKRAELKQLQDLNPDGQN